VLYTTEQGSVAVKAVALRVGKAIGPLLDDMARVMPDRRGHRKAPALDNFDRGGIGSEVTAHTQGHDTEGATISNPCPASNSPESSAS
jgi:hypothetical protein